MERVKTTVHALCEDFADLEDKIPGAGSSTSDVEAAAALDTISKEPIQECAILDRQSLPPPWSAERAILCLGGNTPLDEATAVLFATLLRAHGLNAGAERFDRAIRAPAVGAARDCALIFLNYLGDIKDAQIRFSVRQLNRIAPNVPVLVGCWSSEGDERAAISGTSPYHVVRNFREGTAYCVRRVQDDIEKVVPLGEAGEADPAPIVEAS
jgi:hypothetical protein